MRIAIIGGIGSGKSEMLRLARQMGFACLSADEINSEMLSSADYISEIEREFPFAVKNGIVDRNALAKVVFSDKTELRKLNSIAHPRILKRIECEKASPLIVEMPLLTEIGAQDLFDEIILVDTPMLMRIGFLKSRGMSAEDAYARIQAQADPRALRRAATVIINNDGSLENFKRKAADVLNTLTR